MTAVAATPVVQASSISKSFPGVVALDRVSFDARRGEIHALLGENGAGKSTLVKVLTGVYRPDSGHVAVNGEAVELTSPAAARQAGISLVPQDVVAVSELSMGRNMLLGREPRWAGKEILSNDDLARCSDALAKTGARFGPERLAKDLNVSELRLGQLARALLAPGAVMLLDEPTAVLSEADADHLLARLEEMRSEGKAIVYVSHRLSEVMRIADRVTVLRDGRTVGTFERGGFDRDVIVERMTKASAPPPVQTAPVGRRPRRPVDRGPRGGLVVERLGDGELVDDVSFSVDPGEIVGIAGVQGSGHGRLLHCIAGARPSTGRVTVDGAALPLGNVRAAFRHGVVLVPADRRGAGIVGLRSVRENVMLSTRARSTARRQGWRSVAVERSAVREYVSSFAIKTPSQETAAGSLSGGNQQKVVLARALEGRPTVLLVEEPTQGIDVNAKREVQTLLRRLAEEDGCAVVIASAEFDELIGFVDRIDVMRLGRHVASMSGRDATYADVLGRALP